MILEIACFNYESALLATKYGADRIELCDNEHEGGTTPSYGTLQSAKANISIPIFAMIRPRGGDFIYSDDEFNIMKSDITLCKQMGFEGVVFGLLKADGSIDVERTNILVEHAYPLDVTFHRAFDRTKDPFKALEQIIQCGCTRILTSGQHPSATEGASIIKALITAAYDRIIIMPGSGVRSHTIQALSKETRAIEFHSSAKKMIATYANKSPTTMNETIQNISVDENEIKTMLAHLKD
jgi:copper homeostasis protein